MKKTNLMKGVFAVLLLASLTAGAETQYPAADFQPKVLYKDPDYKATESTSSTKATAPVEQAKPKAKVVDQNYPAADYQPKVLYKDESYKPSTSAPAAVSEDYETSGLAVAEAEKPSVTKKEGSNLTSLIGLAVLALGGFFFFNKRSKAPGKSSVSSGYAKESSGSTGVEKYLASLPQASKATGVEKYLENQAKQQPISGVAKYVAKQIIRDREAAAAKVTGVEKYLRSKG